MGSITGIEDSAEASLLRLFSGAIKRGEIAVLGRNQHRSRAGLFGDREIALGEAEEIIRAGGSAATQLVRVGRIDADSQSPRLQFSHRVFEMGERGVRQASEIDDVGALDAQEFGAGENRFEAQLRRIDDLGEDFQRMARQIERRAGLAKKRRQVFQFIGAALEGTPNSCAKRVRSARQRPGTTTRSALIGRGSLRMRMGSVISAATFTPTLKIDQSNGVGAMPCNTFSRRFSSEAAGQEQDTLTHAATLLRRCAMAS